MKFIYIFHSMDGPMYFGSPKKVYEYAMRFHEDVLPINLSAFTKSLNEEGYFSIDAEQSIGIQKEEVDKY